jgi:hypothetical protein
MRGELPSRPATAHVAALRAAAGAGGQFLKRLVATFERLKYDFFDLHGVLLDSE